jgi:hypothetical protein
MWHLEAKVMQVKLFFDPELFSPSGRERVKAQTSHCQAFVRRLKCHDVCAACTAACVSAAANKERLPAIPDLSDKSGGLSNPVFFSFVRYKSPAQLVFPLCVHVHNPMQRPSLSGSFLRPLHPRACPATPGSTLVHC